MESTDLVAQAHSKMFQIQNPTIPVEVGRFFMKNSANPGRLFKILDYGSDDYYLLHNNIIKLYSINFFTHMKNFFSTELDAFIPDNFDFFGLIRTYMYTGLLEIPRDELIKFNQFVETLHLDILMQDIATHIEFESVDELIKFLESTNAGKNFFMAKKCTKKFIEMFNDIPLEKAFLALSYFNRTTIERLFMSAHVHFGMASELKLAKTFKEWITLMEEDQDETEHDPNDWMPLEHVKFESFDLNTLIEEIRPLELLTDKEYIWFLEQKAKDSVKKSDKKFYVCNAKEIIPAGFRAVTNTEFEAKEFREHFVAGIGNPVEFISGVKCTYLLTASNWLIRYETDNCSGCFWINSNATLTYSGSAGLDIDKIILKCPTACITSGEGYLCVKC